MPEPATEPPISAKDWRDAEYIEPRTMDEARLQLVAQLHHALYGDVWARPEPPSVVWQEMLARVERAANALRR